MTASGTWTIDNDRSAFPLNVSEIRCVKSEQACYDAQANIGMGYLSTYLDRRAIIRWDATNIEFQDEAACVTYTYVIDRATQKLYGRRIKKPDADKEVCSVTNPDLRLTFANGLKVQQTLYQEAAPTTFSLVGGTGFVLFMLFWAWKVIRRRP